MDKTLMLAVAGAGKTTYITNEVCKNYERILIITYTEANRENIINKLRETNGGVVPERVIVYEYFRFLYDFCYKPFLADELRVTGINYNSNPNRFLKANQIEFFLDPSRKVYSNRIAYLFERKNIIEDIRKRIIKYFDCLVIDEIQDISGRDFDFIESLIGTNINQFYVGDFYQHTFDTSRDGMKNASLFDDKKLYVQRLKRAGMDCDENTLIKSWRCGKAICEFVREHIGIEIYSNREENGIVEYVSASDRINDILMDPKIVKLHYQKANSWEGWHKNWGETKGEDCYHDVCVLLNPPTMKAYKEDKLHGIASLTRNKLYVALTRAKGNVYIVDEAQAKLLC